MSSTKAADTAHLDEPIDLAEEDQTWADKLPLGGSFSPSRCLPTTRVAVLLPFRDREAHLATFLRKMHPFLQVLFFDWIKVTSLCLQVQGIQYTLVVLNQTGSAPFMRGLLFNAGSNFSPSYRRYFPGVSEAVRHITPSPDCFVLHDIDHIPEKQGLIYRYPFP